MFIPSNESINEILRRHRLDDEIESFEHKSGTTDGLALILHTKVRGKFVLKFENATTIKEVVEFLGIYKDSSLLPKVQFRAEDYSYFLYSYVEGTTHVNRGGKLEWLSALGNDLLNKYVPYGVDGTWGRLAYPRKSWLEFNETSIEYARENVGSLLPDEDYIYIKSIVGSLFGDQADGGEKFLLHGDTGVHNFVYRDNSIVGVIDPSPMAGPMIYDFVYAFCSSPDDLNAETLFAAYDQLHRKSVDKPRLIQETAVQLYCRIGLSKKHHPGDLPEYLRAWEAWKGYCLGGG